MLVSLLLGHVFVLKIYTGTLQARTIDKYTYNVVDKDTLLKYVIYNFEHAFSRKSQQSRKS